MIYYFCIRYRFIVSCWIDNISISFISYSPRLKMYIPCTLTYTHQNKIYKNMTHNSNLPCFFLFFLEHTFLRPFLGENFCWHDVTTCTSNEQNIQQKLSKNIWWLQILKQSPTWSYRITSKNNTKQNNTEHNASSSFQFIAQLCYHVYILFFTMAKAISLICSKGDTEVTQSSKEKTSLGGTRQPI